ncbi:MAG: hypothetical protein AB7S50_03575 [Bacteroidales bacterium]
MIRNLSFIISISCFSILSFSQEPVSKKDVYLDYVKHLKKNNPDNYKFELDSIVAVFIDSLIKHGVDAFGVYEQDYVGAEMVDPCMCAIIPYEAYVNWIINGQVFHRKITKCCQFQTVQVEYSVMINYYKNAIEEINKARILPVITNAYKNEKGEIISEFVGVDHTTEFIIFCSYGTKKSLTTFGYFELVNQKGLFQEENEGSILNSWRKMIESQISELDKR